MNIKNLLHIYALLVCFVTTLILIITFSWSLNALTSLFIPEYKYYSSLRIFDSNESYLQHYEEMGKDQAQRVAFLKQLSPAQLDGKRTVERNQYLEEQKADNVTSLIFTLQWTLVALVFFLLHWRIYKKSK